MRHSTRGRSTRAARAIANKASQKTKVRSIVSALSFAGNAIQFVDIATAADNARVNYTDNFVKPFSKIQVLHLDIAIYQSGASVATDGYVDWAIIKNPANSLGNPQLATVNGTGLVWIPYIFKTSRAAVPMLTSAGLPTIYHLSGDIFIPPRFQTMAPNDKLTIAFAGLAGAGVTYSVNGQITYMFKV